MNFFSPLSSFGLKELSLEKLDNINPARMQTDVNIRCCIECPVKDIKGYCNECKEFFCKECVMNHIGHKIVNINDFCEERKKNIIDQVSTLELSIQLERRRDEMNEMREKLDRDHNKVTKEISLKEAMIGGNKEKLYEQEFDSLDTVTRYLIELEDQVSTITLKDACKKAMKIFNIKEDIRVEFETLDTTLADMKRKKEEMDNELKNLKEEMKILNYLRGENNKYDFDEDKWTTFLLLNEKISLVKTEYCINTTIDKFRAFKSVKTVFDIEKIMKKELADVGENVKMSESIKVEKQLLTGKDTFASLSHQGVLAICVNGNTMQFTDLNNDRQAKIKVENYSLAGFYDGKVLLLTQWKPLREITVENVFENPRISSFKVINGIDDIRVWADVSVLHESRVLYYYTLNRSLFAFNVDTRTNTEINVGLKIYSIISFTGIDCGIKSLLLSKDDECIYSLNMDNSVTKLNERRDDIPIILFPLATDPSNIKNAMFMYDKDFIRNKNKIDTSKLIKSDYCYSVIRVYRDIFLAYDKEIDAWVLIRIQVS